MNNLAIIGIVALAILAGGVAGYFIEKSNVTNQIQYVPVHINVDSLGAAWLAAHPVPPQIVTKWLKGKDYLEVDTVEWVDTSTVPETFEADDTLHPLAHATIESPQDTVETDIPLSIRQQIAFVGSPINAFRLNKFVIDPLKLSIPVHNQVVNQKKMLSLFDYGLITVGVGTFAYVIIHQFNK